MFDQQLERLARSAPYLGFDEERDLIRRAQAGEQVARDHLVLSHLRLVLKAAGKFRSRVRSLDDLAQDAVFGLIEAIDKFDLEQPVRFSTYAQWFVKARTQTSVMRAHSVVKVPENTAAKAMFYGLSAARAKLLREGDLLEAEVNQQLAKRFGVSVKMVEVFISHALATDTSLSAPLQSGSEFGDLLEDDAELPDAIVTRHDLAAKQRSAIEAAIGKLNEREQIVVKARLYAEAGEEATFEDLSNRFAVSKQRVQQIEAAALKKLRKSLCTQALH